MGHVWTNLPYTGCSVTSRTGPSALTRSCAGCSVCPTLTWVLPASTTTGPCARGSPKRSTARGNPLSTASPSLASCWPSPTEGRWSSAGPMPIKPPRSWPPIPEVSRPGGLFIWRPAPARAEQVAVFAAGTADLPVAEECTATLRALGFQPVVVTDCGVAGVHRLLEHTDLLMSAEAVVVVAGMEGALASLVGGLTPAPVVAVPTSTGYGASLQGVTALLAMLASCAPGLCVVGIDNGFGAAWAVARILRQGRRVHASDEEAPRPTRRWDREQVPATDEGRDGPNEDAAHLTRVAWWNCFSGIAGDMALASLLDAGADLDMVIAGLEKFPVSGWHLEAARTWRGGLAATQLRVDVDPAEEQTRAYVGDYPGHSRRRPTAGPSVFASGLRRFLPG